MNLVDSETDGSDNELCYGTNRLLLLISDNVPQAGRIIPITCAVATFSSANPQIIMTCNFNVIKRPDDGTEMR